MKSQFIYLILALITGALIPVQASTNASFSKSIGSPFVTGLMVLTIGLIGMIVFVFSTGTSLPSLMQLKAAPAYSYLGGIIVAMYVVMITILVPRLGVGTSIALIVTGQILFSVIIDHFGLFDTPVRAIDVKRLMGILMMIGGIYFVMKK
ncbi:MAG: EamA-like transporter family protein [Bacteroidetes bacterium]|jgi:transporter family-2 protein|nr:EamA-like transporter family protein [Bacteroidota bacterium]